MTKRKGPRADSSAPANVRPAASPLRFTETVNIFDEMRGIVIDLPVGTILPGWVSKAAVILAIDRLEAEHEVTEREKRNHDVAIVNATNRNAVQR